MADFLPMNDPFFQPFLQYDEDHTELEQLLKQYHFRHPELQLDLPHSFGENTQLYERLVSRFPKFKGISEQQLGEAATIEPDMDIAIFRHIRYLPALFHTHEFFEVLYVIQGCCTNHIGSREIAMRAGDICIIAPHTEHAISAFADDCLIFNFLIRTSTFDSTFMNLFLNMDVLSNFFMQVLYGNSCNFYLLFHTGQDEEMLDVAARMLREYYGSRPYKRKLTNLNISLFFTLLIQSHEQDISLPDFRTSRSENNLIYILHYLQENYLTISLKELAAYFNYSERQMGRILYDYTGMNFSENIQRLRMQRAAHLLGSTQLSIAEVAGESGYTNISHFRTIFRKQYGISPVEYRASHAAT